MSLRIALLWATLAALLVAGLIVVWLLMPPAWMIPAVYGFLIVFIWVDVFVWCYWFHK